MIDLRWKLTVGLMRVLRKLGHGKGRFVFAIVARPLEMGIEVVVSDTTAIPPGPAVKEVIDRIVHAHTDAVMRRVLDGYPDMPCAVREMLDELMEKSTEAAVDPRLPARSWKSDEVGQA